MAEWTYLHRGSHNHIKSLLFQRIHFDRNIRIVRVSRLAYVICMATNAILFEDLMKSAATQTAVAVADTR